MKPGAIWCAQQLLVPQAWRADNPWTRLRGLLGRPPLQADAQQALWITPCSSIHTIGMRYALDVVFLDRDGVVLSWSDEVKPWRARACRGAYQTIELAPGSLSRLAPSKGEVWQWRMQ